MTDPTTTAGLADRVNQIRVPEPNADRERKLLIGGGVLVAVGLLAIIYAWYQVSGTTNVGIQMPYAVSGGLLGLGLIVLGSAVIIRFSLARLFRYWLARVVYEHQVQTDRTVEALGRIESALTGKGPAAPSAAPDLDLGKHADGTEDGGHRVRREPLRAEPLDG